MSAPVRVLARDRQLWTVVAAGPLTLAVRRTARRVPVVVPTALVLPGAPVHLHMTETVDLSITGAAVRWPVGVPVVDCDEIGLIFRLPDDAVAVVAEPIGLRCEGAAIGCHFTLIGEAARDRVAGFLLHVESKRRG